MAYKRTFVKSGSAFGCKKCSKSCYMVLCLESRVDLDHVVKVASSILCQTRINIVNRRFDLTAV